MPDAGYDAIVIDAFSSDSIPVHLLTREALALYRRKLSPTGVILFHVSNRYLDLAPLVAALARDAGAPARRLLYVPAKPDALDNNSAEVVAVGQPGNSLDALSSEAGWQIPAADAVAAWSRFLRMWERADPSLESYAREGREALTRLTGERAPTTH